LQLDLPQDRRSSRGLKPVIPLKGRPSPPSLVRQNGWAGYFIRDWQELRDQVRQIDRQSINATKAARRR